MKNKLSELFLIPSLKIGCFMETVPIFEYNRYPEKKEAFAELLENIELCLKCEQKHMKIHKKF